MTRALAEMKAAVCAAINIVPPPGDRPALVVMTGLPGTGKSHLARALIEAKPFTLLGSDAVRAALFPRPTYNSRENGIVYRVADALIWDLLRAGGWVIYDAANLSEHRRWHVRRLGLDANARVVTVRTVAPPEVVKERLARRASAPVEAGESQADWLVYERLRGREEPIRHDYIEVDTTKDIAGAIDEVIRQLTVTRME